MKKINIITIVTSCLFGSLLFCSNQQISGNGVRTGNPTIEGVLYQTDGKTPAYNATVYLRKKNSLIDISNISAKIQSIDTATVTTNAEGKFSINATDVGMYVIECTDGNNYALYDSVVIQNIQIVVTLPPNTLKPAGSIKGTIKIADGGDLSKVYVLAFGIDRFASVHNDGSFELNNLSKGNYELRIISTLPNYGTVDLSGISVLSADTTVLLPVELPFIGTPLLKNVTVKYDTLKQIVHLSWNKIDTSLILGFNVYRRNNLNDSVITKLNKQPIIDTFFQDSSVLQNQTYAYRISIVKKDSTEGVRSQEVSAKIATYFPVDSTFHINVYAGAKRELQSTMIQGENGLFYAVTALGELSQVQVLDTNFNIVRIFEDTLLSHPRGIATDGNGRIFVSDMDTHTGGIKNIFVFNQEGIRNKILPIYDIDSLGNQHGIGIQSFLFTVDIKDRIILAHFNPTINPNLNRDSIYVCDTSGTILMQLGGFGLGTGSDENVGIAYVTTDKECNLYVYDFDIGIKIFDSQGTFKRMINTDEMTFREQSPYNSNVTNFPIYPINGFAVEPITNRIFISSSGLYVFDTNGELLTQYNTGDVVQNITFDGKKIYLSSNGYVIKLKDNLP